jgi:hypothetical protein
VESLLSGDGGLEERPRRRLSKLSRRRPSVQALFLLAMVFGACSKEAPLRVDITFEHAWKVEGQPLTQDERTLAKATALRTLQDAFDGFDVQFLEGEGGARHVKVQDTDYGPKVLLGAVGTTFPMGKTSRVRFDALVHAELIAAKCIRFDSCNGRVRLEMIEGLGRGLGATIAHELGHQAAFGFAVHSDCPDCYDGASTSLAHFFGRKRWSERASQIMLHVLPATRH